MMNILKKRLSAIIVTVALALSCVIAIAALAGCKKDKNKALSVPANVTVSGSTLSWDAVEGAEEYTVKINDGIVTTSSVTYDLSSSAAVALLKTGENSLAVKANATESNAESAYSEAVTYNYQPNTTTKLATPANVKVENDTLKWDAVANASGYTVKIGTNETTKVSATSLDLTATAVEALLVKGDNSLYVKANGTGNYTDGDYSAAVTYNYAPSAQEEANAYVSFVATIGTLTENSDKATADGILSALNTAKQKYESLSAEALAMPSVVSAKASCDEKNTAYTTVMATAEEAYNSFKTSLTSAAEAMTAAQSLDTLSANVTAAESKYTALSTLAKSLISTTEDGQYTSVKAAVTEWTEAINTETEKWDVTYETLSDDAKAEANIVKANALLATYEDLPAYVKAEIATYKAAADSALSAAQTKIAATVNALKTAVSSLTGSIDVTEDKDWNEYYETVSGYKQTAEAFGAYAKTLWGAEYGNKITAEISAIKTTVKDHDIVLLPLSFGVENHKFNLIYSAINVLNEKITFEQNPPVSLSVDGALESPYTSTSFTSVKDGAYICTVTYSPKGGDAATEAGYEIAVGYSVNNIDGSIAKYKFLNDTWWENSVTAVNGDNKIQFNGAPADPAYIDIFEDDDIQKDSGSGLPAIKGAPLVSGLQIQNLMTVEELRAKLANEYPELLNKEYSVRFVVYRKTDDGTVTTISNIKNDSVNNDVFTLDITEEDKKIRLNYSEVGMTAPDTTTGGIILGAGYAPADIAAQFNDPAVTADNVKDQLRWIIDVTFNGTTKTFSMPCTGGSLDGAAIKRNVWNLFNNSTDSGYTLQIRLALKEDSAYADILKDSEKTSAKDWNLTVSASDARIPINFNPNGLTATAEQTGDWNFGRWEVVTENAGYHDGITVLVYDATGIDDVNTYDFESLTPFATYLHNVFGYISWDGVNSAITEAWSKLPEDEKGVQTRKFVFAFKQFANDAGIEEGFIDTETFFVMNGENKAVVQYERDFSIPAGVQVNFNSTKDWLLFARASMATSGNKTNGDIFNSHLKCLEIKFENGGESFSGFIYAENDNGTMRLFMYSDEDKTSEDKLNCNPKNDGGVGIAAFNEWASRVYSTTVDVVNWTLSSKLILTDDYYVGTPDYVVYTPEA